MTAYHAGKTQYSTALKICNQSKNRSAELLPTDSHRVFLSHLSDDRPGADYINASWLTGESVLFILNLMRTSIQVSIAEKASLCVNTH